MKIKTQDHYGVELRERIEQHNATAESIETEVTELDARLHELRDPATVTTGNAADRVAAITDTKADRLALAARRRQSAAGALEILTEIQKADRTEGTRLTEAAREREWVIRRGMADVQVTDQLTIARAIMDDKELLHLRSEAVHVQNTTTAKTIQLVEQERVQAVEEIARLLA